MHPDLPDTPLHFFNPYADTDQLRNRLPHWDQLNATYFVTFRLADSIPRELRERWIWDRDVWLKHNPPPHSAAQEAEYHETFTTQMETWLDNGMGSCVLRNHEAAQVVASALHHFEGERCHQLAFVVMPNHVHVLFATVHGFVAGDLVHSWKGYTTQRLKSLLGDVCPGWQKDYFDRLIRDETHFARCVRYIRRNPVKAQLPVGQYVHYESERAKVY